MFNEKKEELVDLMNDDRFIKDIVYASSNNFLNKKVYDKAFCYLRRGTYNKLVNASNIFKKYGYKIVIWDAYRPIEYQKLMWEYYPDNRYVTNPLEGNSIHCSASAVDITLADENGNLLEMPTKFDYFGYESHIDNIPNLKGKKKINVLLLQRVMIDCGFKPFETEWWHFNDSDYYDYVE